MTESKIHLRHGCSEEIINFRGVEQKVYFVNDGVGNNVNNQIYLHKGLKEEVWKDLYDFIVHHEIGHINIKSTALGHISHDAWMPIKIMGRYMKFIATHSGAWKQLLFIRWMWLPDQEETYLLFDFNRFLFTAVCVGLLWIIVSLPAWLA